MKYRSDWEGHTLDDIFSDDILAGLILELGSSNVGIEIINKCW